MSSKRLQQITSIGYAIKQEELKKEMEIKNKTIELENKLNDLKPKIFELIEVIDECICFGIDTKQFGAKRNTRILGLSVKDNVCVGVGIRNGYEKIETITNENGEEETTYEDYKNNSLFFITTSGLSYNSNSEDKNEYNEVLESFINQFDTLEKNVYDFLDNLEKEKVVA